MENLELAKKYILKALDIDKSYGLAYIKMAYNLLTSYNQLYRAKRFRTI